MADLGGLGSDPFWSVVRRREPDLDIVVLPEPESRPAAAPVDPATLPALAERLDGEAAQLWRVAAGSDVDGAPARWAGGSVSGSVARENRFATTLDPAPAREALDRLQRHLTSVGWHVLAPPDGLPRVLAGREDAGVRHDAQAVFVPATGRFALTVRAGSWATGRDLARSLVGRVR